MRFSHYMILIVNLLTLDDFNVILYHVRQYNNVIILTLNILPKIYVFIQISS